MSKWGRVAWRFGLLMVSGVAMQTAGADRTTVGPGDHRLSLRVGDRERRYLVYVPPRYDGRRPVAAVVFFHGAGGTAQWSLSETGWGEKADREGFLAIFPDGTAADPTKPAGFLSNPQLWNDGSGRTPLARLGVDDVAFARTLVEDIKRRYVVDDRRVYVTGFSNGAGLTFTLAAKLSDVFAAVAPVASHCWLKDPHPGRALPTLYIVGTQDPLIPGRGHGRDAMGPRHPPAAGPRDDAQVGGGARLPARAARERRERRRDPDHIRIWPRWGRVRGVPRGWPGTPLARR